MVVKIRLKILCTLCVLCGGLLLASESGGKTVTILFTGETHATLGPCDCPVEPMGGLARRAAMVKRIRRDHPDALLVDAGGAFAGGFYDEGTRGEALDRERTEVAARAMGRMGYDAVCVGDEELAFGPAFLKQQAQTVPFLSANLVDARTGAPLMPAHRIREAGGVKVGLIGLTTPEVHEGDFREAAEGLKALNPVEAAAQAVRRLRPQVDLIVVLSHLGESGSALVAQKVPGIDVLINGHRRSSGDPEAEVGQTLMAQFSYQGRQLGRVDVVLGEDGKVKARRTSLIDLGREAPDDPEVAAEVEAFERRAAALARVRLDLYGMGECPYCSEAEQEIHEVVRALGDRVDVRFYYVVGEDAQGGLVSLHGPDEVAEDLRQIAVQRPGRGADGVGPGRGGRRGGHGRGPALRGLGRGRAGTPVAPLPDGAAADRPVAHAVHQQPAVSGARGAAVPAAGAVRQVSGEGDAFGVRGPARVRVGRGLREAGVPGRLPRRGDAVRPVCLPEGCERGADGGL